MYTFRKWVFTQVAIGELIAIAVLTLLSLILAVNVYYDIRFKISYHRALSSSASGRLDLAIPQVQNALSYRGDFASARELYAKILIDGVKLDTASMQSLAEAENLLKKNIDRQSKPTVATYLCLAAVHIKRYDLARARKEDAAAELTAAAEAIGEAESIDSDSVDAMIMRFGLLMRQGQEQPAAKLLDAVEAKIKAAERESQIPTLDMMLDFYIARMSQAYRKKDASAARQESQRALAVRPGWEVPLANMACLEAKRLAEQTVAREELDQRVSAWTQLAESLMNVYRGDPETAKYARDAAYGLTISIALAYANLGDHMAAWQHIIVANNLVPGRATAYLNYVAACSKLLRGGQSTPATRAQIQAMVRDALPELVRMEMKPGLQVSALNNLGVSQFAMGQFADAKTTLEAALDRANTHNLPRATIRRNLAAFWCREGDLVKASKFGHDSHEENKGDKELQDWLDKFK